jgi:CRP-like cAMP-binding protein
MSKDVDKLAELYLFKTIPRRALQELCIMAPPVSFKAGAKVFGQGDSADVALLLIEGELSATVEADGLSRNVGKIGKGEVVGEQALFVAHGRRTATVTATQASLCLILTPKVVDHAFENVAIVALEKHLLGSQARRIRNTNLTIQQAWKGEVSSASADGETKKKTSLVQRLGSLFGGR